MSGRECERSLFMVKEPKYGFNVGLQVIEVNE